MVKTKNRKNKKNRKNIKKTKKVHGGEPNVITVKGLYDDDDKGLVAYYILHNKMNDEQKQQYADKHNVFISSDELSIEKMFEINPKNLKKLIDKYFYPSKSTTKFVNPYPFKTVVIHQEKDIEKIKIANKIIENINSETFTDSQPKTKYDVSTKNIMEIIKEYKKFINDTDNEKKLLKDVTVFNEGKEILRSPAFLKIIGGKYGIFADWSDMEKRRRFGENLSKAEING